MSIISKVTKIRICYLNWGIKKPAEVDKSQALNPWRDFLSIRSKSTWVEKSLESFLKTIWTELAQT